MLQDHETSSSRYGCRTTCFGLTRRARALREMVPYASIGIALNLSPCEPETEKDVEAAQLLDGQMNR